MCALLMVTIVNTVESFTIRDCSIFLIFVGSLANESTLSTKTNYKRFRLMKLKSDSSKNYISTNKQNTHNPLKMSPTKKKMIPQ